MKIKNFKILSVIIIISYVLFTIWITTYQAWDVTSLSKQDGKQLYFYEDGNYTKATSTSLYISIPWLITMGLCYFILISTVATLCYNLDDWEYKRLQKMYYG